MDWVLFDLLNPFNLQRAVLAVYARYEQERKEPGAGKWERDDIKHGPILMNDVRDEWASQVCGKYADDVDEDPSLFPYCLTFVRMAFVSVRKMQNQKKLDLMQYFGIPVPDRFEAHEVNQPFND